MSKDNNSLSEELFDVQNRYFDEGYPPIVLEEVLSKQENNLSSFVDLFFTDSYRLQVKTLYELGISSCLEIGPGDNFTRSMLENHMDYQTLDIFGNPDYKIALQDIPDGYLKDSFSCCSAFQVLEHFPYTSLQRNLSIMRCIAREYVVISLPFYRCGFSASFNFHLGQRSNRSFDFSYFFSIPWKKNRKYRKKYMEYYPWAVHYFELGRNKLSVEDIKKEALDAGLDLLDSFHSKNPYHQFFVFKCL